MSKRQRRRQRHIQPATEPAPSNVKPASMDWLESLTPEINMTCAAAGPAPNPMAWLESIMPEINRLAAASQPAIAAMNALGFAAQTIQRHGESQAAALRLSVATPLTPPQAEALIRDHGLGFAERVGGLMLLGWDLSASVNVLSGVHGSERQDAINLLSIHPLAPNSSNFLASLFRCIPPEVRPSNRLYPRCSWPPNHGTPSSFVEVCGEANVGRHQTPCTACRNHDNNPYLKCAIHPLGHPEERCRDWEEITLPAIASLRHFDIHCEAIASLELQNYRLIIDAEHIDRGFIPTDGSTFSATAIFHSRSVRLSRVRFLTRTPFGESVFECLPAPGSTGFHWLIIDDPDVRLPHDPVRTDFCIDAQDGHHVMFDAVGNQIQIRVSQVSRMGISIDRTFSLAIRFMGRSLYLESVRFREFRPESGIAIFDCLYVPGQASPYRWL